ncbi:hypothetical protein A3A09_01560 [Candidatus Nomurabacteria bacterium RIFCSPLOWO2_01_FULL_42_20]|uniref:Uncharacterized protein n=1 Tax=Candidatus Nomurabacteria bacterium RIFCSPHIGHO2_01_FULL_42_16 TaxID=1801743 RepID=A0A1F6VHX3_9BACT|nr:MAG: hypothetical protein A2824_01600 [Candidatus Nomurabacteria bacterium RIFCSPHIGHO2_01_FULL_42_16]OGI92474.1 MAG: hypothetical protein A3A09_01560 [Candidatus Nomurabacteria bacterium RIFCSPLOWO2_01_FULL_42_20]
MPKIFTSEKQKIGKLGEDIACKFLVKHKFSVICQNYTKKWGELDIVAEKDKKLHFIEVKSVSVGALAKADVSHSPVNLPAEASAPVGAGAKAGEETSRPEENIHPWKVKRILRAVQTYLLEKRVSEEVEWQIDVAAVFINLKDKKAKVRIMENAIN